MVLLGKVSWGNCVVRLGLVIVVVIGGIVKSIEFRKVLMSGMINVSWVWWLLWFMRYFVEIFMLFCVRIEFSDSVRI